jgi:hypothetical protein
MVIEAETLLMNRSLHTTFTFYRIQDLVTKTDFDPYMHEIVEQNIC